MLTWWDRRGGGEGEAVMGVEITVPEDVPRGFGGGEGI